MIIYVIERHDQLLDIWRGQNAKNLCLVHLDFHCDMNGLLIDRIAQRAYQIKNRNSGLNQGNFLTHAVCEGRIQRVRWIHDIPGGRRDDVQTVKYDCDLSARFTLWRLKKQEEKGIPLEFEEKTVSDWRGLEEGEFLDIDWDVFASNDYTKDSIDKRTRIFLNKNFNNQPENISVCYSPDYSHPTHQLFDNFVKQLADMFGYKIEHRPSPLPEPKKKSVYKGLLPPYVYKTLGQVHYKSNLWLRRRGIY